MYKLIIGNVKVTVADDGIDRLAAAALAREAVAAAAKQGKLVGHIDISAGEDGPVVETTMRAGSPAVHRTIRQSMLDAVRAAAQEKLYPTSIFASKDAWFDADTGQEWYGDTVNEAREEIMAKLTEWLKAQ